MKTNKRILPALLMAMFAGAGASPAGAQQFNGLVVFGDSLSDAGYYRPFLSAIGVPSTLVPVLGRFTTSPGPIWAEVMANDLGLGPVAPSNAGGLDYAQGGARVAVSSPSTPPGLAQRPVSTQVNEYLAHAGGAADPHTLYAMWGGANDVIQTIQGAGAGLIPPDQVSGIVQGAAVAEIGQIGKLQAAGAKYILVFGLPNIGGTPAFTAAGAAASAGATAASAGYNTALFTGLKTAGLRVIPVDTYSMFTELIQNPSAYGFTNVTVPACKPFPPFSSGPDALFCPPGNTLTPNAAQTFLFADGVHPTTASHQIIAEFAESMITGPTAYSLLAETPIAMRQGNTRGIYEGLGGGSRADIGRMSVFATYDKGKFDIDSSVGMSGVDTDGKSVTVGVTARVSETVILGL
ncbi:MAG TPA: SGNH/GDSL hydrolase family protein, partial [Steroidobacteraceae bacterium]|nr:SGNH/GDSL hydrolase family protein [Steroidobacteraceae bacterium]